ncbi:chromosomal replication initiator protein DnaA [Patescibacteria group bacterium]|nr:chromosomal replication initiator protein DnaA [Patescibacteria group bacterium]MBU1684089.1 chromosomal replication initiator protein DnaA [Patescibacteria group bacterium]MBU1778085.1 chromosomal replication initiator protein DnaA [Patescibacteria group bacterium]MBU1987380.1 chromosomal replication initiator protein DnaA [Patescibacteria group bacterium]
MDNNQIWQAVLGEMELNLSKANFITWLKQTFISSFEDDQVVIGVPNIFTKTWIERKYHKEIYTSLKNITNIKIKQVLYKTEIQKNTQTNEFFNTNKPINQTSTDGNNYHNNKPVTTNRFGLNSRYLFDTFIVGKGNELACAACQAVVANPGVTYNPLLIHGGVGLGKTHLLQAVGNLAIKTTDRVLYATSETFSYDYINTVRGGHAKDFKDRYRNVDLLLIDDVQFMGGKDGTQEAFFHTFNDLHNMNKQIVITSDRHIKSIPALEKRLASRLGSGMIVNITLPDIETRIAILEKKCKEKNYSLTFEILNYIASHVQDSIRDLEGALNRVIAVHEFNNSMPTKESVEDVLNDLLTTLRTKAITAKNILEATARFYDISIKDLIGKRRQKELVFPRQIAIFLMREDSNLSYPAIGQEIGGRDHTTAIHSYNKIAKQLKINKKTKQEIESIKQLIYSI